MRDAIKRGGIARQYWRAWIETGMAHRATGRHGASPASIGGRGLKLVAIAEPLAQRFASPASIGGRGLKLDTYYTTEKALPHRPPVLAGVD